MGLCELLLYCVPLGAKHAVRGIVLQGMFVD